MDWQTINFARKFFNLLKNQDPTGYHRLGYYGIIGNLETVALIGANGSIDWCCLPHLESPSVFAKLLDRDRGGFFSIHPNSKFEEKQNYLENTNILQTKFSTKTGTVLLTDFMPPFKKRSKWHKHQMLIRKIQGIKGLVPMKLEFRPRFDYARKIPKIRLADSGIVASAGEEKIFLDAPVSFAINSGEAESFFTIQAKEEMWVVMQYNAHVPATIRLCVSEYKDTLHFWQKWAHSCQRSQCVFNGPWHDLVVRSGLTLKLLTHGETGAIAAAATTSIPEIIGGTRNWDYRYNWIRDSVFTAQALYNLGHIKDAKNLLNWYKKIYKGVRVADIQIMHGLHGENELPEKKLNHLAGYKNSRPVRIGNAAVKQKQLDIYGELLNMAYETSRYGESLSKNDWRLLRKTVNHVCKVWNTKDAGIWEMRASYKHFVFSKIMCWVAVDLGLKIAQNRGMDAPLSKWIKARDEIKSAVLKKGFNPKLNSFVQSFGSKNLDATNLLLPLLGFLPFDDPRIEGTIQATKKHLMKNGLVYRYTDSDGLPGQEGAFVLCTFWLVDALALSGKVNEAEKTFLNLIRYASPLGLLAEEIDPDTKMQLGNYPQAFSHTGLINSALYIGLAKGKQPPKKTITPAGILKSSLATTLKFLNWPFEKLQI